MTSTSRELVQQTLSFGYPARVPRQLWLLPWANIHHPKMVQKIQHRFPDDIVSAPAALTRPLQTAGDAYTVGRYVDEWGCVFDNIQAGMIGEVKQPLLKNWDERELIRLPRERLSLDREAINSFCESTDQFVVSAFFPRPFERLQFIRGAENLYYDLISHPEELEQLLHRLHNFYQEEMARWAETKVDALMFMDDWGSQHSTLISPELWRRLFKPLYRDYIDIAHSAGKYAFMHSDGHILAIIPDLVELGLDALNSQISCMGIEELGVKFGGKLTFWGELDRQRLLPDGTAAMIVEETRQMQEHLYHNGGVIAQCEFGPGANPENVYTYFETWEAVHREKRK